MSSQSPNQSTSTQPAWLAPAFRWLTLVNALLIVVQAFLASQGFFGGTAGLIKRHGEVGNLVFLLFVAQGVIALMLANSGRLPRIAVVLAAVAVVLIVAQIGLGYSTRDNFKMAVWHVTNGVLLMGVSAVLMAMAWMRPLEHGADR